LVGALLYRYAFLPLVRRSRNEEQLEADSILSTFGLLFVIQGIMLALFGGDYMSYSFLSVPTKFLGTTIAVNRLWALGLAVVFSVVLYLLLTYTRIGTALRA